MSVEEPGPVVPSFLPCDALQRRVRRALLRHQRVGVHRLDVPRRHHVHALIAQLQDVIVRADQDVGRAAHERLAGVAATLELDRLEGQPALAQVAALHRRVEGQVAEVRVDRGDLERLRLAVRRPTRPLGRTGWAGWRQPDGRARRAGLATRRTQAASAARVGKNGSTSAPAQQRTPRHVPLQESPGGDPCRAASEASSCAGIAWRRRAARSTASGTAATRRASIVRSARSSCTIRITSPANTPVVSKFEAAAST